MRTFLNKKAVWIVVPAVLLLIMLFSIEESRTFLIALFSFYFVNISSLMMRKDR